MKTAVSIPDDLYRRTDRLARRLRKSRSAIYAAALSDYVSQHDPEAITAAYNEVVDSVSDDLKDFRRAVISRTSRRIRW